jgi:signal transduction histidine kinase/CheY-like chemotaxis protein
MSAANLRILARCCCGFAAIMAALVLSGWMLDNPYLKRGALNHPPMLLSSAVLWLVASTSLFIATSTPVSRTRIWTQRLLATIVFFGGLCAASDSLQVRSWVEESLASLLPYSSVAIIQEPGLRGGLTPILFAVALLYFHSRRRYAERIYQGLAILPVLIALLALIGHAYNIGAFYGASGLPLKATISLPGAIATVLFGIALLAARPELETTQLMVGKTVGGYVARRLILAPVLIPLASGYLHIAALKTRHYDPQIANWLVSFTNILVFTVVIGMIAFLLHRTDGKRNEAETTIRDLNENLENQVRSRTDELTKTNLRLTHEIAERKKTEEQLLRSQRVECLGTLAGGIAHDLNNMLSPIAMASALIESELPDEESKRYMEIISKSAQRGTDLIKQIMTFARGTKGETQKVDLTILLCDLQKTIEATLSRSIRLQVRFAPHLPLVLGDPTQICQVLMNLCVNARDAMPEGGTLKIEASATESATVQITVSDTGTGISKQHLSVIFEPFFTTKAPGKGTGLGLATVKKIVESHGGTVRVQSDPGQGTSFCVTFPATAQEAPMQSARADDIQGDGEHILVIEDELALREILKATLEQAHYVVTAAANGIEAIQIVQQNGEPFQLVLTDFEMPFMSGEALVLQLANLLPSIPLVVMTGSLELTHGKKLQADKHCLLAKPFTASDLLGAIHRAIHPATAQATASEAGLIRNPRNRPAWAPA